MRKSLLPYGVVTAQGNWSVQEDGYWIDSTRGCFVLADGFGGKGAGDLAVKSVLDQFANLDEKHFGLDAAEAFLEIAHTALGKKFSKAGCSLGWLWVRGNRALAVNTGAISCMLYREGKFETVLSANGVLSQDLSISLPLQALGVGPFNFDFRWLDLRENDIYLMTSGGIYFDNDTFKDSLQKNLSLVPTGESLQGALELALSPLQPSVANQSLLAVQVLDGQAPLNF